MNTAQIKIKPNNTQLSVSTMFRQEMSYLYCIKCVIDFTFSVCLSWQSASTLDSSALRSLADITASLSLHLPRRRIHGRLQRLRPAERRDSRSTRGRHPFSTNVQRAQHGRVLFYLLRVRVCVCVRVCAANMKATVVIVVMVFDLSYVELLS